MKTKTYFGKWKSEAAELKCRQAEEALWDASGIAPAELIEVPTNFGPTVAHRWVGSGTPVVFLHGMTDTSRRWIPYIKALTGHDLYAIDLIGEAGRSRQEVPFTSADDYAVWLNEALAGFGIEAAHVVGMSLGGFVALDLAARYPDRVTSLVLFEPIGIVPLRLARFMLWGLLTSVGGLAPDAIRRRAAERLRQPVLVDGADTRLLRDAYRAHPPALVPIEPLSDGALGSIAVPVRVILGAKSEAFDTAALAARANDLLPNVTTEVIADAGHTVGLGRQDLDLGIERVEMAVG